MGIPVKSNTLKAPCSPTSSNCVIWQGPCLPCINLNTGDSISEVIHSLAIQICDLITSLDISQLDFKCLIDSSLNTAEPEKTLVSAITLLINKVCSLEDLINNLPAGDGSSSTTETVVTIA